MAIVRWTPLRELEDMRNNLDKLFGDLIEPVTKKRFASRHLEPETIIPDVDMFERKGDIVVKADLPGVEKENIDLSITKEALTIKGEVKRDEEVKKEDYYAIERSYGRFLRTIQLPVEVDSSKAKASYKNGVLEVILPKKEEAKPHEIKVDVN
ncbi:MAG: Hsp20/alpha crystallin family protein [Nitrospirota bacterium]